jgi:hypothetical protein
MEEAFQGLSIFIIFWCNNILFLFPYYVPIDYLLLHIFPGVK